MPIVTFEVRDAVEIQGQDGEVERQVNICGFIDGAEVATLRFAEDSLESAIQEHMEWEFRRRGLLPR